MSDEGSPESEAQFKLVEKAAQQLSEHFDHVQVFTSTQTDNGARHFSWGSGNWFARYGQVKEWIVREEERSRETAREEREGEL